MRVRLALVPFVAGLALLAGCTTATPTATPTPTPTPSPTPVDNGVSALPAAEIETKALAALAKAKSVHVVGPEDPKQKIDVLHSETKTIAKLSIEGIEVEMRVVGTDCYLKAGANFYALPLSPQLQALANQASGKWLHFKTTNVVYTILKTMIDPATLLKASGTLTKGATKDISGQPTIALVDSDKTGGTLYVATTGEPLPVQLDPHAGGTVKITYDEAVVVDAPPAAETVELPAA